MKLAEDGERIALLLLPGMDGTGELLRSFADALPRRFTPLIVPYPQTEVLTYDELARFVERRFPADGRFALLGESFSGPLALRLAAKRPATLVAVILVASFVRNPVWRFPSACRWLVGRWLFHLPAFGWPLRHCLAGADAPPELLARVQNVRREVASAVLAARARAALAVDATDDLRKCPVPVLYLGGTRDRIVRPGTAAELKAIRPDLELAMLDAPHLLLQRRVAEAAALVARFLSRPTAS
ncbi:MAG: alpha/beta fold hydrolase [Planctomycetaceae bacterium]